MYDLRGRFFEACDCNVVCPCWVGQAADGRSCNGTVGWYVEEGQIDGLDVSGLCAASFAHHFEARERGEWRVVLYLDEQASAEQQAAMRRVFSGEAGGPLGELSRLTGQVLDVRAVSIELVDTGRKTTLRVGEDAYADFEPLVGATRRITRLTDSALAVAFGTPAELGVSRRYRVFIPAGDFDIETASRHVARGRFHYSTSEIEL